ncbi:MAG TPA: gamma-glutamylcyclotransferase family protein [Gammaproteobacteria bacterium]|nr:gamma-glutamylcyclotransferase family protein [Gammaproteobacteria bacterium]
MPSKLGRAGRLRPAAVRRGKNDLLFVYGTLRPFMHGAMARRLRAAGEHLGAGAVRGRLYDLGPYPGLVDPRAPREWVIGDLYRLATPAATLRLLDRYEGAHARARTPKFMRVERIVRLSGRNVAAWIYLYRRSVAKLVRIRGGDYLCYVTLGGLQIEFRGANLET